MPGATSSRELPAALLRPLQKGAGPGDLSLYPELAIIVRNLPPTSTFSLLADQPYATGSQMEELLYTIQNYICPRLLNPEETEAISIVYCSNETIAEKRLSQTGYKTLFTAGNGKGIAVKK